MARLYRLFRKVTGRSKTDINKFIRKAALNKEPIFDAYKKLCKIHGNMDYVDFELKYYQYYHGNKDSAMDSSPMTFSDLPIDILQKVLGKLALEDCLVLRKVSHGLRNLVDSTDAYCEGIDFDFQENLSRITFANIILKYQPTLNGCCRVSRLSISRGTKNYDDSRSFEQAMVADALTILKNPKFKIRRFRLSVSAAGSKLFLESLRSLNFQLNVQSVYINADRDVILRCLQILTPGSLEEIGFAALDNSDEIVETEQWKKAKKLWMLNFPAGLRAETVLHFEEIKIGDFALSERNLVVIRDILLKSTHLKVFNAGIAFPWFETDIRRGQEKVDRIMSQHSGYDSKARRFSIPNSRDYFQLGIGVDGIWRIDKVSES